LARIKKTINEATGFKDAQVDKNARAHVQAKAIWVPEEAFKHGANGKGETIFRELCERRMEFNVKVESEKPLTPKTVDETAHGEGQSRPESEQYFDSETDASTDLLNSGVYVKIPARVVLPGGKELVREEVIRFDALYAPSIDDASLTNAVGRLRVLVFW